MPAEIRSLATSLIIATSLRQLPARSTLVFSQSEVFPVEWLPETDTLTRVTSQSSRLVKQQRNKNFLLICLSILHLALRILNSSGETYNILISLVSRSVYPCNNPEMTGVLVARKKERVPSNLSCDFRQQIVDSLTARCEKRWTCRARGS